MKNPLRVLLCVGLTLVAGCGVTGTSKVEIPAQGKTGILVQGEPEATKSKMETAGLEYRTLNAKHGFYEVYGVQEEDVRDLFPGATIETNQYVKNLIPVKNKSQVFKNLMYGNGIISKEALAGEGPEAPKVPEILSTCNLEVPRENWLKPHIKLGFSVSKPAGIDEFGPSMATAQLNQVAKFSETMSTNSDGGDIEDLKVRWMVNAPGNSKIEPAVRFGTKISFKPDNVGLFDIVLVAEDINNVCGIKVFSMLVTANPKLKLPKADDKRPTLDFEFKHRALVNADEAAMVSTGKGITLAVLDTGLNFNSPGIKWNLAVDKKELLGTKSSDNDGNGFDDDVLGWDFVNDDNNAFDDEGHGSHVSGISGSHIFGIAPDVKILPVKVMNAAGGGDFGSVTAGILYAVDKGADIINMSLGTHGPTFYMLKRAIEYAESKGVLVVVAAGNGHPETGIGLDLNLTKLDFVPDFEGSLCGGPPGVDPFIKHICGLGFRKENLVDIFPAEFDIANVLTVAATNEKNKLTRYSNFASPQVQVAAPGGSGKEPIWSLATQNAKGHPLVPSSGTSMASPLVAGVAALLLELRPELTPEQIIMVLTRTGIKSEALNGKVLSGKVVNAAKAIKALGVETPRPAVFAGSAKIKSFEPKLKVSSSFVQTSDFSATAVKRTSSL